MSALTVAERCGAAALRSAEAGQSRRALLGTAFHALAEGSATWDLGLTADEVAEVQGWSLPVLPDGAGQVWREATVSLNVFGESCEESDPAVMSVGHLDVAWIESGLAHVVDIKSNAGTEPDGPAALQVEAYALAFALQQGAPEAIGGLWIANGGYYMWGARFATDSDKARQIVSRIASAFAKGPGEITGGHCSRCWGRRKCKSWMVPAVEAVTGAPLGDMEPLKLLQLYQATRDLADDLKGMAESIAADAGIPDGEGKVWRKTYRKGGQRFDAAALKRDRPDLALLYMRDVPSTSGGYRWCKS